MYNNGSDLLSLQSYFPLDKNFGFTDIKINKHAENF